MGKILIADDNIQITRILSEFARKEGFEPVTAHDGIETTNIFKQGKHCRAIHPETSELIEHLLTMLKEKGEKETFRYIRRLK